MGLILADRPLVCPEDALTDASHLTRLETLRMHASPVDKSAVGDETLGGAGLRRTSAARPSRAHDEAKGDIEPSDPGSQLRRPRSHRWGMESWSLEASGGGRSEKAGSKRPLVRRRAQTGPAGPSCGWRLRRLCGLSSTPPRTRPRGKARPPAAHNLYGQPLLRRSR